MDLGEAPGLFDICCESCGTRFSIVDNNAASQTAASLDRLGQFEILQKLGAGAFGTVWKARDTQLERVVAIKIPHHGGLEPAEVQKFLREARAAAQLRHPNIVNVFEVGRENDTIYIVCDYVEGVSLAEWLAGKQVTAREAARLCRKIAFALEHAHAQGIIHRDVKPGNIILDAQDEPHLTDFGLARGEAHHADHRTDIYSLGVVLFQLLTGKLPFRGDTRMLVHQVIHDHPPNPRKLNAHVPRNLATICLKCLEKEPNRRYGSTHELGEDLDRFLGGETIRASPSGLYRGFWRWCRHKPALAVMMFVLVMGLGLNLTSRLGKWPRAERTAAADPVERQQVDEAQVGQLARPFVANAALATEWSGTAAGMTRHAWLDSPEPTPPYTNWATAARVIQEAVDAAAAGDEVLVTNGLYVAGGRAVGTNTLVNRVALEKPLTLRSVNGPQFTLIQGSKAPTGTDGHQRQWRNPLRLLDQRRPPLRLHALKRGDPRMAGWDGRSSRSTWGWESVLNNCTLTGNSASNYGGGALCSTLNNCALTGNFAGKAGGGVLGGWQGVASTLTNCTLTANSAPVGGGATDCTLNNCNTASDGANHSGGTLNNCCTTPLPERGDGNITLDPQLIDALHLGPNSPCRGAGDGRYVTGVDIDGEP
jgi:hypothetical protein